MSPTPQGQLPQGVDEHIQVYKWRLCTTIEKNRFSLTQSEYDVGVAELRYAFEFAYKWLIKKSNQQHWCSDLFHGSW